MFEAFATMSSAGTDGASSVNREASPPCGCVAAARLVKGRGGQETYGGLVRCGVVEVAAMADTTGTERECDTRDGRGARHASADRLRSGCLPTRAMSERLRKPQHKPAGCTRELSATEEVSRSRIHRRRDQFDRHRTPARFLAATLAGAALFIAAPSAAQDTHGVIAFGETDEGNGVAYGFSWNFHGKDAAHAEAVNACISSGGTDCVQLAWFQNGCGALAIDQYGNAQGKPGMSLEQAEARALRTCEAAGGGGCNIVGSVCVAPGGEPGTWSGSESVLPAHGSQTTVTGPEDESLTSEERIQVQQSLTALGFDAGPTDGVFGRRTRSAIWEWQNANGLEATGHVTREQFASITDVYASTTQEPEPQQQTARAKAEAEAEAQAAKARVDVIISEFIAGAEEWGIPPLHYVVLNFHQQVRDVEARDVVEELVARGADIDEVDYNDYTPLMLAADGNDIEMAHLLIDNGANVGAHGAMALRYAANSNAVEIAKLLIDNGVNVNETPTGGSTALFNAAWENAFDTAKLLIESGANVNHVRHDGLTPLHNAAIKHSYEVAKLLTDHGALVNAHSRELGLQRPLCYVYQDRYHRGRTSEMAPLLLHHGGTCKNEYLCSEYEC